MQPIIINIDNDMSHLRPYRNIKDCIIDLTNSNTENRLKLRTVLLNNKQVFTDDNFSDIWSHWDYITAYCCSHSGEWNITGLDSNISLEDFIQQYKP